MRFDLRRFTKDWVYGVEPYVPGEMREGYIKLASNENNYGPSPGVVAAVRENAGSLNIYPYRGLEVRDAVAEYCGVGRGNVVVGNGSDELIELILKGFKSPVFSFNPTFTAYKLFTQIFGGGYVSVDLEGDFSFPREAFVEGAGDANIIFMCSPNNPTGSVVSLEDVRAVLDLGRVTVVDEAYFEFYGETAASLLGDYSNLIVLRTFSKAFGLGGLRVGYCLADPGVVELLYRMKQPFSVNSFAQLAALAALQDVGFMKDNVARVIRDREVLYRELGRRFRVFKSYTNFVLVDSLPMSSKDLFKRLYEEKIIVRRLGGFPGFKGDYTRISVGTSEECRRLIEVLKEL